MENQRRQKRQKRSAMIEIGFPKEIIQHIQSFMDGKEAAGTTLVSKHWYSAWRTRPNLDFDHRHFPRRNDGSDDFSESTNKIMQRYRDLNLNIKSLRLCIDGDHKRKMGMGGSVLANSVVKAMQLGATDLTIEFSSFRYITLVDVLVFKTLTRLSLSDCIFDPMKLDLPNLKSLYLSQLSVIKSGFINDLVSRSLLIEELTLKKLDVDQFCDGSLMNLHKFRKLKYLCMEGLVGIKHTDCFDHSWSGFECLKELVLWDCDGCRYLRIGSRSLERISIRFRDSICVAEFDVPNIQKFHFEGSALSSFKFETTTAKEWESHIHIITCQSSFYDINRLVTELSPSKVYLSIHVDFRSEVDCTRFLPLPHLPVVENLTLLDNEAPAVLTVTPSFLDALLLSCRPNFIVQSWFPNYLNNYLLHLLVDRLADKARIQVFEGEWRSLPWKTLLDASACPPHKRMLRFHLR